MYVDFEEMKKWWRFFDSLTNICISYAHDNAGPTSKIDSEGKMIFSYSKDPFSGLGKNFPRFSPLKEAKKNDEAAKKNGVFKMSVKDRLIFPIEE